MKKINKIEAIRSTTMFLIDDTIEKEYEELIQRKVVCYQKAMKGIDNEEGLRKFIVSNHDSIEMLETILGISGERMKRVITMIRVNKGYTFDTEWSEKKLQENLVKDECLLTEYCELFLRGRELYKYKQLIPKFILDYFFIDENTINRVANADILTKMYKEKNSAGYSSSYSKYYINTIKEKINKVISPMGYALECGDIENVGEKLHYITYGDKYIIITFNYSLTTGQGQTTYSNKISTIYKNIQKKDNIILVNMLDGAGWIGRSADFKKIFEDCNYYANLQNINLIGNITKEFFNI